MQIHNAPKFKANVDNSEPPFENLLSENHDHFFDMLGQLSGFIVEQNSPTVSAFIEKTKEQAASVGSLTVFDKLKTFELIILGLFIFATALYLILIYIFCLLKIRLKHRALRSWRARSHFDYRVVSQNNPATNRRSTMNQNRSANPSEIEL